MELLVQSKDLKTLLRLFPLQSRLEILELGDTGHPSSGFVDAGVLGPEPTLRSILENEYDFRGLVLFDAMIDGISIQCDGNSTSDGGLLFRLRGDRESIEKLKAAIRNRIHQKSK